MDDEVEWVAILTGSEISVSFIAGPAPSLYSGDEPPEKRLSLNKCLVGIGCACIMPTVGAFGGGFLVDVSGSCVNSGEVFKTGCFVFEIFSPVRVLLYYSTKPGTRQGDKAETNKNDKRKSQNTR